MKSIIIPPTESLSIDHLDAVGQSIGLYFIFGRKRAVPSLGISVRGTSHALHFFPNIFPRLRTRKAAAELSCFPQMNAASTMQHFLSISILSSAISRLRQPCKQLGLGLLNNTRTLAMGETLLLCSSSTKLSPLKSAQASPVAIVLDNSKTCVERVWR